ncbi:MAG: TadE/TadG family type IV pilus assembly protein [Pseudomonadota bacterium]
MRLTNILRRLRRDEEGATAFDFVLVFPVFFMLFLASFESGMLMTRQVMLDRGVEQALRIVRLNTFNPPTYDQFHTMVCQGSGMIGDCLNDLRIEMVPFDPFTSFNMNTTPSCTNRSLAVQPATPFQGGADNQMVFVRACVMYRSFFPSLKFGSTLSDGNGEYALTAMGVFVAEPSV